MEISLDDLEDMDEDLSSSLRMNTRRYLSLLGQAIDQCMPEPDGQVALLLVGALSGRGLT